MSFKSLALTAGNMTLGFAIVEHLRMPTLLAGIFIGFVSHWINPPWLEMSQS
jgi:hypothetical protein